MNEALARKTEIFDRSISYIASALTTAAAATGSPPPTLYGPNNQPIPPDSYYSYRRAAAKRTGTMKTWLPQRLLVKQAEALERQFIVQRAVDLANGDPQAAGIIDMHATTVVGAGLLPMPLVDQKETGLSPEDATKLAGSLRNIYRKWAPTADANGRLSIGQLQYLAERCMMIFGEYIALVRMIDDPITRPYMLCVQLINPARCRTPVDMWSDPRLKDGVEMDDSGRPVAYWIKKSINTASGSNIIDTSGNFYRVPVRSGHRINVIHGFMATDTEQVRGWPRFAPALKFFRDLNDYLDAELVSNIVTAAFALFIQTGTGDPLGVAQALATITEEGTKYDGSTPLENRYQELQPGAIMYGNANEIPHPISAQRPGATFEPFTKTIKKAIAFSINMPYAVAFKDVDGVSFAGFRSAMLEAWRIFEQHRTWLGQGFCQPLWTMLQEEAYLRGEFDVPNFYTRMDTLTRADWQGPPKGDIEPIKEAQADILLVTKNMKTRAECITERGGDLLTTFDALKEEQDLMAERGLTEMPFPSGIPTGEGPAGITGKELNESATPDKSAPKESPDKAPAPEEEATATARSLAALLSSLTSGLEAIGSLGTLMSGLADRLDDIESKLEDRPL